MNYRKLMEQYRVDMIDALRHFLVIPSVYDDKTKTKEKPFGENVDQALKYIGRLGEFFGFDIDYCDGYATEITIGEGDKLISIFAHADVVPATGKWTNDPFDPVIIDNKMYSRGTSDDKGPLIAAFYAAKALKDNGLIRNFRLRFVVGGDEERGSSCLEYYFHNLKKEYPTYGFTPDSDFPLIYGEKGITDFYPVWNVEIPHVKSIKGGLVSNAVCDNCVVELDDAEEFVKFIESKKVRFVREGNKVTFIGKSCHGSTPALGENAAFICLANLGEFYRVELLKNIADRLSETSGKKFNGFKESKLLGETTYCVGKISYEKGKLNITVNFRYPENVNQKEFVENFDKEFSSKSTMSESSPHLLYDPECTLVQTLLEAYRKETGDNRAPLTTGGGTYAKHAKNTIAFGALFPERESRMHEPDEYIDLDDLFNSSVIYAHAIDLLGKAK